MALKTNMRSPFIAGYAFTLLGFHRMQHTDAYTLNESIDKSWNVLGGRKGVS